MQQKPQSPRTAHVSPSRIGLGADTVMVRDYGRLVPSLQPVNQGVQRTGHGDALGVAHISALDLPGPLPPQAVWVTGDALGPANAEGIRQAAGRSYIDLDTGQTVQVDYHPASGTYHPRLAHQLAASPSAVSRVGGTWTWTGVTTAAHASAPVSMPMAAPVPRDPRLDLQLYDARGGGATTGPAIQGKRQYVMGGQSYYGDARFSLASFKAGDNKLYVPDARGVWQQSGAITEDGIIQISGDSIASYLEVGGVVVRVDLDSTRNKYQMIPNAHSHAPGVYLDTGGSRASWVPEMRLGSIGAIIRAARKVLGYTTVTSDMSQGVMSTQDRQTYCYMRQYARQMIAFDNPAIRNAPAHLQDRKIDTHIWTHGYPYGRLLQGIQAKADGLALPMGIVQFDPFQGMATVAVRREGSFNVDAVAANDQFHYPHRQRRADEIALFDHWKTLSIQDAKGRGLANEKMYRALLVNDGYQIIPGGTYGGGQNGFDLVFKGPAGDVYVLEVKHAKPRNVSMQRVYEHFQMEDGWVRRVLKKLDRSDPGARQQVADALDRQRLFKVIGATLPDGKLVLFKIDMSGVRV